MEVDTIENFCHISKHKAMVIHQKDPDLASILKEADYPTILNSSGLVRNGKGEAMVIGMMIAKIFSTEYVGFIDADNFVPSTSYEYIQSFAAGFSITKTPYSMVRVSWRFKPKISNGGLYFRRRGRVSEITNRILNLVISDFTGFGSQIIKTGNAGEHAISLKLAELLQFASGFAIEPYEIVNLLEKFGKGNETDDLKIINDGVEILQIESRSPHFHDAKGESHLKKMLLEGLASIFHSNICSDKVKQEIINDLKSRKIASSRKAIPKPKIMEPIISMDFDKFRSKIFTNKNTLHIFNINTNLLAVST
jgi:mannosyl-3-phosphoglycerate synthase